MLYRMVHGLYRGEIKGLYGDDIGIIQGVIQGLYSPRTCLAKQQKKHLRVTKAS